jgi:hypothetical protein
MNMYGQVLDSPSTTSQISYKVLVKNTRNVTNTVTVNRANADDNDSNYRLRPTSSLVVMEIAG